MRSHAVYPLSARSRGATNEQRRHNFVCFSLVLMCFVRVFACFWAGLRAIARQQRSIPAVSKTQLRVILRAG